MNDISRTGLDTETPVNPYSLLEAVNRSSDTANTAWLLFIGLMAYLLITVAGVTHKDLLLNAAITLPVLQVNIELTRFFLFAPIVLVLLHLGVVGQLVLLARKTLEFGSSIRMLEISDQRTHPLRLELDNFFFVQAMAGPGAQPHRQHLPARHVVADAGGPAAGHAALHPDRVPALPRCRHHLGASRRRAGRHRAAAVHRRVPDALGNLVLPRLLAHQPASPAGPAGDGRAAGGGGLLLAVRRHHSGRAGGSAGRGLVDGALGHRARRALCVRLCGAGVSIGDSDAVLGLFHRNIQVDRPGSGGRQGRHARRADAQSARIAICALPGSTAPTCIRPT